MIDFRVLIRKIKKKVAKKFGRFKKRLYLCNVFERQNNKNTESFLTSCVTNHIRKRQSLLGGK